MDRSIESGTHRWLPIGLRTTFATLCLVAGACDGGTPTPSPTPSNRAPAFTSAATASVAENLTAAYQATATDADGDPLTFTIAGGADAARFAITPAGALTFVTAPDFEAPADAGANNVYDVQIGVNDARGGTATLAVQITVTNTETVVLREVFDGFPDATSLTIAGAQAWVAQRNGTLTMVRTDIQRPHDIFISQPRGISTAGEGGLLDVACGGPQYCYILLSSTDGYLEVRAYLPSGRTWTVSHNVIRIPHAASSTNYGSWLGFGPDGYLYIGTGDGGGTGDPAGNAQNRHSLLGKILRIDPRVRAGSLPELWVHYFIPADNPYADGVSGAPEVWAYGFRNPSHGTFWGNTLLVSDMGESRREEIDMVTRGGNFGWPFREGTLPYAGVAPAGLIDPVLEYAHGTGPKEGQAVVGGPVVVNPAVLNGRYMFGDFATGALWTVPAASLVQGQTVTAAGFDRRTDFQVVGKPITKIVDFDLSDNNRPWILDASGTVYEMVITD